MDQTVSRLTDLVIFLGGTLAIFLVAMLLVGRVYVIPSPSMVPNLEIGDMVFVSKYSYGWRPYSLFETRRVGQDWSIAGRLPERGDIVVVRNARWSKQSAERSAFGQSATPLVIKRVVGLPGDDIRLRDGRLEIRTHRVGLDYIGPAHSESEPLTQVGRGGRYLWESFPPQVDGAPRVSRHVILDLRNTSIDNYGPVTVPDGHLFLMGDNRDNSDDSRTQALGFVPVDNLIGRAQFIVMSWRQPAPSPIGAASMGGAASTDPNGAGGFPLRLKRFFRPLM